MTQKTTEDAEYQADWEKESWIESLEKIFAFKSPTTHISLAKIFLNHEKLLPGGELFDRIIQNGNFTENEINTF